jgi:hypothetical protein
MVKGRRQQQQPAAERVEPRGGERWELYDLGTIIVAQPRQSHAACRLPNRRILASPLGRPTPSGSLDAALVLDLLSCLS